MPFLSNQYHLQTQNKDTDQGRPILDAKLWPKSWLSLEYKEYPRLPKIKLANVGFDADLKTTIEERKSDRDFDRDKSLTFEEFSALLKYSCGETTNIMEGKPRRAHPSGGARFPLEIYPVIFRPIGDIKAGLYHYNPKGHSLSVLEERVFTDEELDRLFVYDWTKKAQVGFVVTAVFERSQRKYGDRGYRYILIEAGHVGQNVYLVSGALKLKCVGLGGTWDESLAKFLDIDGNLESVIYALAVGK